MREALETRPKGDRPTLEAINAALEGSSTNKIDETIGNAVQEVLRGEKEPQAALDEADRDRDAPRIQEVHRAHRQHPGEVQEHLPLRPRHAELELAAAPDHVAGLNALNPRWHTRFESALAASPKLTGTLVVKVNVEPDGSIKSAAKSGGTLTHAAMIDCVVRSFNAVKLASESAASEVTVELKFGT